MGKLKLAVVSVNPVPLTVAHCSAEEFHSSFWKIYWPLLIETVPNVAHVDCAAAEAPSMRKQTAEAITNLWKPCRLFKGDSFPIG